MAEIWKPINNYENYIVSNQGRIMRRETEITRKYANGDTQKVVLPSKILTPCDNGNGYLYVQFGLKDKHHYVHRLVAETFIPNPNNLPQINHRDENPHNNNVDNLEWCDAKYNCNYGHHREKISKPVLQYDKNGVLINEYKSIKEAEDKYKVSHIWDCCVGKRKHCGGYNWKYKPTASQFISAFEDFLETIPD